MLVLTANVHAGVDGYGRTTRVIEELLELSPDVLFVQELWRGEMVDQFDDLRQGLGAEGAFCSLATCTRITQAPGGKGWQPWHGLLSGDRGLYFDERLPLDERRRRERDEAAGTEVGAWGVALLTRYPIRSVTTTPLPQLPGDKTTRALIVAEIGGPIGPFYAAAVHGAHLTDGSLRQYRTTARLLRAASQQGPLVVGGDFNCWRPLLRTVLPGFRSAVRAKTWPAWRPHSQIDHLLLRGPWNVTNARAIVTESDHRALSATLSLA